MSSFSLLAFPFLLRLYQAPSSAHQEVGSTIVLPLSQFHTNIFGPSRSWRLHSLNLHARSICPLQYYASVLPAA